jgi:hypothetical protein
LVYFKLGNFGVGGESLDSFKRQIGEIFVAIPDSESPKTNAQATYFLGGKSLINLSDHLLAGGYAIPFKKK